MKTVMAELITLLHDNNVDYVICGANALSLYSKRPRMTIDIDAFVDINQKQKVDTLLSQHFKLINHSKLHSKFMKSGVEVDILYAGSSAEEYAIKHKRKASILGVSMNVTSPDSLLWLYVVSGKEQNTVDAIELVRSSKNININLVKDEIKKHNPHLLDKLEMILNKANIPESERGQ